MQSVRISAENADASSSERFLAAVEALLAQHGYYAVSMNTIAAGAGASKASIFHHFSSKNVPP